MEILSLQHPSFSAYGRILLGYPTEGMLDVIKALPMGDGLTYQARDELLHTAYGAKQCIDMFFGGMPGQLGYLTGRKTRLDALTFYRSCALYVAAEDFVLLMALPGDMEVNKLDTGKIRAFRVPAGTVVEIYGGVMHALRSLPESEGFRAVICLPYATNSDYRTRDQANFADKCLWARNAWVLAHRFAPEAAQGANVALDGENLDLAR